MSEHKTQELQAEFEAGEGSFLGTALSGTWDEQAFRKLCTLMQAACIDCESERSVLKWMASGFHELDTNLDRYLPPSLGMNAEFVEEVKEHLMFLACWFFSGVCPFESPQILAAELDELLTKTPAT